MQSSRGPELEVADGTTEAVIAPIKLTGRGGKFEAVGASKIWTEKWGLLELEDHAKKMKIEEEEAALEARLAKDAAKRAEAKKAKTFETKAKDTVEVKAEADCEVVRADSGLAKVKPRK